MSCSTYTIVTFCSHIRLTQPQPSCDRRFRFLINPPLSYGIVVDLKVHLRERRMQIGARTRKRVKIFHMQNRATHRYFCRDSVWTECPLTASPAGARVSGLARRHVCRLARSSESGALRSELRPHREIDATALSTLINAADTDMKERLTPPLSSIE